MATGFDFSAFIGGFQEEAEERLQSIEATLVELEKGREDPEKLESLRRDAHSVKGSANMLQLPDIGETAHVLEDTFAYLRDGMAVSDQTHLNFMFELLDSLRSRIGRADDPESEKLDPDAFREHLENLDREADSDPSVAPEAPATETMAPSAPEAEAPESPAPDEEAPEPSVPGEVEDSLEESDAGTSSEPEEPVGDPLPSRETEAEEPESRADPAPSPDWEGLFANARPAPRTEPPEEDADEAHTGPSDIPDSEPVPDSEPEGEEARSEPELEEGLDPSPETEPPASEGPETLNEDPAEEVGPQFDWKAFVPGVREEARPVLKQAEIVLAGGAPEDGSSDRIVADLVSLSASLRQVELDDAAEAVELLADVLRSPASAELPDSLRELLKGVVGRIRKRLDEADGPDGKPLDRDRIGQARTLLEQSGLIALAGAAAHDSDLEPEAESADEAVELGTDIESESGAEEGGEPTPVGAAEDDAAEEKDQEGGPPPIESAEPAGEAQAAAVPEADASAGSGEEVPSEGGAGGGVGMDLSGFLDGFQGEARENLDVIQQGLLAAEREEADEETLDRMARQAHSLKGSANMLGLNDLGEGSELLEDGIVRLRAGNLDREGFDALLGLHDALREAVDQIQQEARESLDVRSWRRQIEPRKEGGGASSGADEAPRQPTGEAPPEAGRGRSPAEAESPPTGASAGEAAASGAGETTSRRSSSGRGSLRVSANRLERLSESVIGLAMDRATQDDRQAEIEQINANLREIRRQWEWFENILPSTGALVTQRDKLSQQFDELTQQVNQFRQEAEYDTAARHALYDEIHQRVMDLMVSPLSTIFSVLPRSARDLAQRFEKRVELTIEGSEIELERKNVDALLDPLVHLVTNAISHGIEDPEDRKAAGKDPVGHIRVEAEHVGGEVAISVSDDGRGIDYEKVRETAIRTGVTTAAEAENMLPYDLLQVLFRPGFSTKEDVGQISGRGIGMNSVREAVQRMTGSIQVDSEVGEGTAFTLNIPVSTAVQRILKFRVGGENYGVLANQVERIMTLDEATITEARGQRFCDYAGNQVPVTWLSELFNTGDETIRDTKSLRLVIVRHLEGYIGFVVHEVMEEAQAVVKDVTHYLRRHAAQGLIGTTISGSGEVQLLLEPTGIKEMERTSPLTLHAGEHSGEDPLRGLRVLLVEDSPLARQMEKAVLENVGMEVDTAVDGLDALDRMEVRFPDMVISDIEMPRMDGYDLLRKLRDDDRYRGLPVFVVTSRESQEDRDTAHRLGADGFLNKLDLQSGDLIEEIRGRLEHLYA